MVVTNVHPLTTTVKADRSQEEPASSNNASNTVKSMSQIDISSFKESLRQKVGKQAARQWQEPVNNKISTAVRNSAKSFVVQPQHSQKIKEMASGIRLTAQRSAPPSSSHRLTTLESPPSPASISFEALPPLAYPTLPPYPSFIDVLSENNEIFLKKVFIHLLHREPDEAGKNHYLQELGAGKSQIEVLLEIWNSSECMQIGTQLAGLKRAKLLRHAFQLPLLGKFIQYRVEKKPRIEGRICCSAITLQQYDGEAFIRSIYRAILNREPDANGLIYYGNRLQTGVPKIRLIRDLYRSREGKTANSTISDYAIPSLLERASTTPIIGWIFSAISAMCHQRATARIHRITEILNSRSVIASLTQTANIHAQLVTAFEARNHYCDSQVQAFQSITNALGQNIDALSASIGEVSSKIKHDSRVVDLSQRLADIESQFSDKVTGKDLHTQLERLNRQLFGIEARLNEKLTNAELDNQEKLAEKFISIEAQLREKITIEDLHLSKGELEVYLAAVTDSLSHVELTLEQKTSELEAQLSEIQTGADRCIREHEFNANLAAVRDSLVRLESILEHKTSKQELISYAERHISLLDAKSDHADVLAIKNDISQASEHTTVLRNMIEQTQPILQLTQAKLTELVSIHEHDRQYMTDGYTELQCQLQGLRTALNTQSHRSEAVHKDMLHMQYHLRMLLRETRARMPEPLTAPQLERISAIGDHYFQELYANFEERFRGERTLIAQRLETYIPFIEEAAQRTDCQRVIDLGCGRGEWLELMKKYGYSAIGVDVNREFIRQNGTSFTITESDAIEYLRNSEQSSVAAITSFHMIEHIPTEAWIELLDEALRVLKPGGVLILETPNPENLIVGACNFHFDPTHRKPIPPELLRFVAEDRGFVDVQVEKLHPNSTLFSQLEPISEHLAQLLGGPQDYAVICQKA